MRIQIQTLSKADRFKCKFGIFNLMLKFENFHVKIRRGALSAINSLQFFPRLNSENECLAEIGDFCEFADTKILLGGEHPNRPVASTFGTSYEIMLTQTGLDFMPTTKGTIIIGPSCTFSLRTTVLSGSTIGHNSLIAAGALVNGAYPSNSVIAGIPGNVLRNRVDQDTLNFLDKYPWWNASYDWIIKSIQDIQNKKEPPLPFELNKHENFFVVIRLGLEDARIQSTKIEGLLIDKVFIEFQKMPTKLKEYLDHFDGIGPVQIDTNIFSKCGF